MDRRVFSTVLMLAVFVAFSLLFAACHSDSTAPNIYFLAKDGESIDKKGDTTILLYTKYEDPGCYIEDNASLNEDIQVTSNLETVLVVEKKIAAHMGEVKKTGEYVITYTATDEAGNVGTRDKKITCKNISDIYTGRYYTKRDEISSGLGLSVCRDTAYFSNVTASQTVAGRMRFSKVACHEYNGQKVSFKVDADLFSPTYSPREMSSQIGYLGGLGGDKESVIYKGLS